MSIELHLGYVGKTESGKRVEIVLDDGLRIAPYKGDDGYWYMRNGAAGVGDDIVGPWIETPFVGKWIRWDGGECPVHGETTIDVVQDNGYRWCRPTEAKYNDWHSFRGAYRIRKEHVEPPKPEPAEVYTIDPKSHFVWYDVSDGLIHVREVLE